MWHESELYCDQRHCFRIVYVFHTLSAELSRLLLGLRVIIQLLLKLQFYCPTCSYSFYTHVNFYQNGVIASRSVYERAPSRLTVNKCFAFAELI